MRTNHKRRMINDIDLLVSQRLKARRLMLGISLRKISRATQVSITQIQKYEQAADRISSGKLYQLAQCLEVPINYFFDPLDFDMLSFKKEELEFIKIFSMIKKNQLKKQIIGLIKAINEAPSAGTMH